MRLRAFRQGDEGAIIIFVVMMIPLMILCGGLAIDIVKLNAQKRYVQSQADLAAFSAARFLPDVAAARRVAQEVVTANAVYGTIVLARTDFEFGSLSADGSFRPALDPHDPPTASALRVSVPSRFTPILLGPLVREEKRTIRRKAAAGQKAQVAFTLRNRLIALDSRQSVLDAVFGPLGLQLYTGLIGYDGLAQARVNLSDLLGFLSLGVSAGVLTFDDVLDLPLTLPLLVRSLVSQSHLPTNIRDPAAPVGPAVTLGQILAVSPSMARLHLGDILPDISLNAFDLLAAFAGLAADPANRVAVSGSLSLPPLANVALSLGIVRPPVMVLADMVDATAPRAEVAQVSLGVNATVVGLGNLALLRLALDLDLGQASAEIRSLNCAASAPEDILAEFDSQTAVISAALNVSLIETQTNVAPRDLTRRSIIARSQRVVVPYAEYRRPVIVENPLSLTGLVTDLDSFLTGARGQIQSRIASSGCSPGLLGLLGCSLGTLLNATLMLLLNTLNTVFNALNHLLTEVGAAELVDALLDLTGIKLAQAEIILDDYHCSAALLE